MGKEKTLKEKIIEEKIWGIFDKFPVLIPEGEKRERAERLIRNAILELIDQAKKETYDLCFKKCGEECSKAIEKAEKKLRKEAFDDATEVWAKRNFKKGVELSKIKEEIKKKILRIIELPTWDDCLDKGVNPDYLSKMIDEGEILVRPKDLEQLKQIIKNL